MESQEIKLIQIQKSLDRKIETYNNMMGSLYQDILAGEIDKLRSELESEYASVSGDPNRTQELDEYLKFIEGYNTYIDLRSNVPLLFGGGQVPQRINHLPLKLHR